MFQRCQDKDMHFESEERLVLLIAKASVYGVEESAIDNFLKDYLSKINWDKFFQLIFLHDLGPYAYNFLQRKLASLPANIRKDLEVNFYNTQTRNQIFWEEFQGLSEKFNQAGINFIPIKGLSYLFLDEPLGFLRPMIDLDILLKEEQLEPAMNLVMSLGYQKDLEGLKEEYWRKKQYHLMFSRKENRIFPLHLRLELHWALDYERGYGPVLPLLWKRTKKESIDGRRIRLLSNEDALFCLALHKRHFGRTLLLKDVCDTARLMRGCYHALDWDYILKESREGRMLACMYFLLSQMHLLLDGNTLLSQLKRWPLSRWRKRMINKFILQNTFSVENNGKDIYLKSHFLLSDSLWEPIKYIINIPQEQFAKFYDLSPYGKKTNLFYKLRPFYILFSKLIGHHENAALDYTD